MALSIGFVFAFLPFTPLVGNEDLGKMFFDLPGMIVVAVAYLVLEPRGDFGPAANIALGVAFFAASIFAWGAFVFAIFSMLGAFNGTHD